MGMATTLEREVKLRFDSVEEARTAVQATGATPLRCRRLQEDALLDDPSETLRQRRCVLRVRVESGKSLLTFKGPVQPSPMKLREEIETVIGDGEMMLRCLEALGYGVWFRYQKYREEFALGDVVIAIDETPVGVFVEIEGGEQGIVESRAPWAERRTISSSTPIGRSSWSIGGRTANPTPTCCLTRRSRSPRRCRHDLLRPERSSSQPDSAPGCGR